MRTAVLLLAVVGGAASGLLAAHLAAPEPAPVREPRRDGEIAALRQRIDDLNAQMRALRADRLAPPARPAETEAASPEDTGDHAAAAGEAGAEEAGEPDPVAEAAVTELVAKLKTLHVGHMEAQRLHMWLATNPERIPAVIRSLESAITNDPKNADLRVSLATVYVALLSTAPPGPRQAPLWGKASASYDAAMEINPDHWQARYGKAFALSMAPEFIGLRPEAIRQFEVLLERQERLAPEPDHVETYLRLGTLYKDAGNTDKARELWERGLRLFPEDARLKGTLDASTKK
jgi:tetratricopeptide (TPR) repeat protein